MRDGAASIPIEGTCDPHFARVREAFASNFFDQDEIGSALSIVLDGVRVVDLWGGHQDAERRCPWQRDTLVNAYSVGKGILAILFASALEQGALELDASVSRWWPEFAAAGKQGVSVRTLVSHRAGLPAVRERLPAAAHYDWSAMTRALGAQAPYWEPGSDHGYHANTYGFLVGELLRRALGRAVDEALRRFVTGPLDADFHFGVPASELRRVSTMHAPDAVLEREEDWARAFPASGDREHDQMVWHSYFNPIGISGMGCVNSEAWRRAVIPSANGHGTARAVASLYAALIDQHRRPPAWPGPSVLALATSIEADGPDRMLGRPSRFGLGFQLSMPSRPLGIHDNGFGHYGYGGSLGYADPDANLGFAYLINRPGDRWQTPRTKRILAALHECL